MWPIRGQSSRGITRSGVKYSKRRGVPVTRSDNSNELPSGGSKRPCTRSCLILLTIGALLPGDGCEDTAG
jgi:hypothetical protein